MAIKASADITLVRVDDGRGIVKTTNFYQATESTERPSVPEAGSRNFLVGSEAEQYNPAEWHPEFLKTTFDLAPFFDRYGLVEVTLSFELYAPVAGPVNVYSQNGRGTKYNFSRSIDATTEWARYSVTFTPSPAAETTETEAYLAFYGIYESGVAPHARRLKMELGSTATPWSPAPEDLGWFEDPSLVDAAKPYLWSYSLVEYSDGTYEVIGPILAAARGENGKGIQSADIRYQAGASQIEPPGGTWSADIPKLSVEFPYLWVRTEITYTDGTASTSYSVSSTLDGVEVGGRNLVNRDRFVAAEANGIKVEFDGYDVHIHGTNAKTDAAWGIGEWGTNDPDAYRQGETYTLSTSVQLPAGLYLGNYSLDKDGNGISASNSSHLFGENGRSTTFQPSAGVIPGTQYGFFGFKPTVSDVDVTFRIKLERGNKATDWTPAPEDVQQGIDNAEQDAANANGKIDDAIPRIEYAESELEILNTSISSLVVDQDGSSLMTQTSGGWQFNIGGIQDSLNQARSDLDAVESDMAGVSELANKTSDLANDIAEKTAYINMSTDEDGQPCIELGKTDNDFKLRITNTSIDFMQGTQKIAYISNHQLYIQSSVVTDELKIGDGVGWIWKRRTNGNLGLRYVAS